jgi:hypothetical protein
MLSTNGNINVDEISNGEYTFKELQGMAAISFLGLCSIFAYKGENVWKSMKLSTGKKIKDMFIIGVRTAPREQIIFYIPISYWDVTKFAKAIDEAPEHDGHLFKDTLERIIDIINQHDKTI